MKHIFIIFFSLVLFASQLQAQEQPQYDNAADSIYLKCLYKHKSFASLNLLQFVVGTANINYEYFLTKQVSLKAGVGSIIGYRIFVDEYENCLPGGYYYTIEPRWYTYPSTKNCWMQIGIAASYKYWSYTQNEMQEDIVDGKSVFSYNEIQQTHYQAGMSVVGKHPVSGGFTFEYQAGIGGGQKNNSILLTPNVGFSVGWIF